MEIKKIKIQQEIVLNLVKGELTLGYRDEK